MVLGNRSKKISQVLPTAKTASKSFEKVCRICIESESESIMISPCRCMGSVKFVHESCLKSWIISQGGNLFQKKCELCHSEFQMDLKYSKKCKMISINKSTTRLFYLPMFLTAAVSFVIILYLVATNSIKFQGNNKKEYRIVVIIFCGILSIILMMLSINIIKEMCFEKRLSKWVIKSGVYEKEQSSKGEHTEKTLINEIQLDQILNSEDEPKNNWIEMGKALKNNIVLKRTVKISHKKNFSGDNSANKNLSLHKHSISQPNSPSLEV